MSGATGDCAPSERTLTIGVVLDAYPVSWVCERVKGLLEGDLPLSNLWVEGEATDVSRSQRGHQYFRLREGSYQMQCVMFQRQYRGTPLANGDHVLAHGNVSFYTERGQVQIVVDFVQPAGLGARQAEFERLKAQLEQEGLFDPARKRPLPPFPRTIGVVTSPASAVFHDICNVLSRRWPLAEVLLAPTPVQGPEAAPGVAEAIRQLNARGGIDVIVVARGGGSMEELWAFNEEAVARSIYSSAAPVVSAIGHETDFTIADFVADIRAPTPSAAAETVAPDRAETLRHLRSVTALVQESAALLIDRSIASLERQGHRLTSAFPDTARLAERVAVLTHRSSMAVVRLGEQRAGGVATLSARLGTLNPAATLARGYAVVQVRDTRLAVTSVKQVKGKERLDVHVKDGKFPAEVSRQYGF
jgi:exodeoxyribonuclease VII large subunit